MALINEFSPNPTGGDPATQFVELIGEASSDFSGFLFSIEGDFGPDSFIDSAEAISGTFDENGLLTVEIDDLENPSFTLVLTDDTATATPSDFVDSTDPGTFSILGNVLDAVGTTDGDGEIGEFLFGELLGGVDLGFTGDEPQLVFRDATTGDFFQINDPVGMTAFAEDGTAVDLADFDMDPAVATFGAVNPTFTGDLGDGGGGVEEVAIYEIQGAGHLSPFAGQTVTTSGIVTAVDFSGFYLQDPDGDGDIATSDAIFVATDFGAASSLVSVGDEIILSGMVEEINFGSDLSTTQITSPVVDELVSTGNTLPDAVIIGEGGRLPPEAVVISESELPVNLLTDPGVFNPEVDGIDFYESLEGMRVTVENPITVSATNGFDETWVVTNDGAFISSGSPDGGLNDRGGININADADGFGDLNPERVQLQYDAFFDLLPEGFIPPDLTSGTELSDVTGVVGYSFGNFEVLVTEAFEIEVESPLEPEVTEVVASELDLSIATYNILNVTANVDTSGSDPFDPADEDADQIAMIAEQIVNNLGTPDILALQEVQDNNGENNNDTDDGVLDADATLQAIVDAIVAAGGPEYEFVSAIVDEAGETGGVPGGNIRNAFLYNPNRVEAKEIVTLEVEELTALGVTNPTTFDGTRDPLLGTFIFEGEEITLINNHLTSRFGSTPIFGAVQPFVQAGEAEREAEALALNEVVDALLADDPNANVVVLGDLNTFEFTDELTEDLPGVDDEQVLTNLITDVLTGDEASTFIFQGNSQVLDHIFVTDSLLDMDAMVDIVHVNNDFPVFASDHEPVVATFTFDEDPDVSLSGGSGSQTLIGGGGDDDISGGSGADELIGGAGDDDISGGSGRDDIDGGIGNDVISGGSGADVIDGGVGNDDLSGGGGKDEIFGGDGNDAIFGGGGKDLLDGGEGDDDIFGGGGRDILIGGLGNDLLNGGGGRDTVVLEGSAEDYVIDGNVYTNTVTGDVDTLISIEIIEFGDDFFAS
ncbi:MAG: endonuclease/exonuclease/phosphatase family protein [Pseudomonadota bacterium]